MIRYYAAAATAKLFSTSSMAKQLYRSLGNTLLTRLRTDEGLPERYVERAGQILRVIQKCEMNLDGKRLLEIGTGWVHWESVCIRLLHDVRIALFDVWDNRLIDVFLLYVTELEKSPERVFELTDAEVASARDLLGEISEIKSFDELYKLLGFEYVIEPTGALTFADDNSIDLVYSVDVLEHVHRDSLSELVQETFRLLKSGGYSYHQIDMADHLAYYSPGAPTKNYLRHSDRIWDLLFESDVQYVNRIQRPEWLELFESAGLELVDEATTFCGIDGMPISPRFREFSQSDLECMTMRIVHKKPLFRKA